MISNYCQAGTIPGMPGATSGPVPVMRMFGVNRGGNSVCCHVHGFHPYFYVTAPPNFRKENLKDFREGLNAAIMNDLKSNNDGLVVAVLDVALEQKSSIYGYQGRSQIRFFLWVVVVVSSLGRSGMVAIAHL